MKDKELLMEIGFILLDYHFYATGILKKKGKTKEFFITRYSDRILKLFKEEMKQIEFDSYIKGREEGINLFHKIKGSKILIAGESFRK